MPLTVLTKQLQPFPHLSLVGSTLEVDKIFLQRIRVVESGDDGLPAVLMEPLTKPANGASPFKSLIAFRFRIGCRECPLTGRLDEDRILRTGNAARHGLEFHR